MKKLGILFASFAFVCVLISCGKAQAAKEEAARMEAHHKDAEAKIDTDKQKYDALNKESQDLLAEMMQKSGSDELWGLQKKQLQLEQQLLDLSPTILSDLMDTWVGSKSDDLLAKWGSPESTFKDSQGNTVWTYRDLKGFGVYTRQTKRQFWINKDNVIYNWRWEGL